MNIDFFNHPPSAMAIATEHEAISHGQLQSLTVGAMEHFRELGIAEGDRVVIPAERNASFVASLLALLHVRATAVPLDSNQPQVRREQLATIADAKIVVPTLPSLCADGKLPPLSFEQDATIVFSSGSTGTPKAALHSLGNHIYSALGANENMPLVPGDRWLLSLPTNHVGGLAILFRCLLAGAAIAVSPDKSQLNDAIQQVSPTHISLVPAQLRHVIEQLDASRLKAVLLGGAVLPQSLCEQAIDLGLPLYTTYGSTELSSQVCTGTSPDSVGRVLNYRELKLADDGEILLKGKTLFQGYLVADGIDPSVDADGWFHSGDLGRWSGGSLQIIGRKDNMFISGGENIQPEEIERQLLALPEITEAIVVPRPDNRFGFRPVAFLSGNWDAETLASELSQHLPKFMIPYAYLKLPQTQSLKPSRAELIAQIEQS